MGKQMRSAPLTPEELRETMNTLAFRAERITRNLRRLDTALDMVDTRILDLQSRLKAESLAIEKRLEALGAT